MNLKNLIEELRLSPAAKRELDAVVALPEIQEVFYREEKTTVAQRQALIDERAALPAKFDHLKIEAGEKIVKIQDDILKEEECLRVLKAKLNGARAASAALIHQEQSRIFEIDRILLSGADPRIVEFKIEVARIADYIRNDFKFWVDSANRNWFNGGSKERVYDNNVPDMEKALSVVNGILEELEAMRCRAISKEGVTLAFKQMSADLIEPLKPFELDPPTVNEAGEVKLPARRAEFSAFK